MTFYFHFTFFKNDILLSFQSRTEDLTHNVPNYVSSVYSSKIDVSSCLYESALYCLIRALSFIGDLRLNVRGEHVLGVWIGGREGGLVATSRGVYMPLKGASQDTFSS